MARNLNSSCSYLIVTVLGLFLFFFSWYAKTKKRSEKNAIMIWSRPGTPGTKVPRSRGPARTGPRGLEGPVVPAGQDLESLKVPGLF